MTTAPAAAAPAPEPAPAPVAAPAGGERGRLVLIRPDGSEGETFPLGDTTIVGREAAGPFASDSYLSPQHAEFAFGAQGLEVRDLESLNGVYLRIAQGAPAPLEDGSIFRIGQEILRFERLKDNGPDDDGTEAMGSPNKDYLGRIVLVTGRESHGNAYCVPAGGMHLGRERGEVIFPEDGYVSGLHCRLHEENGTMFLTDVGSSNGTFIRVTGGTTVSPGALLLMGQQLFRVEF